MATRDPDTRAAAVGRLRCLRDDLEAAERRSPAAGVLTDWSDAVRFNGALCDLAAEIGEDRASALRIGAGSMVATPAGWPKSEQRPPAVRRHLVLTAAWDALRRLGEEEAGRGE